MIKMARTRESKMWKKQHPRRLSKVPQKPGNVHRAFRIQLRTALIQAKSFSRSTSGIMSWMAQQAWLCWNFHIRSNLRSPWKLGAETWGLKSALQREYWKEEVGLMHKGIAHFWFRLNATSTVQSPPPSVNLNLNRRQEGLHTGKNLSFEWWFQWKIILMTNF